MLLSARQKQQQQILAINATTNYNKFVTTTNYGTSIPSLSAAVGTVNTAGSFDYGQYMYSQNYAAAIPATETANTAAVNTDRFILLSDTWRLKTSDTTDFVQIQRYDSGSTTWQTVFQADSSMGVSSKSFTARSSFL